MQKQRRMFEDLPISSFVIHHSSLKGKICNFTLVELLVVVAIIAILAGMLLPALNKARGRARAIECTSREKQVLSGMMNYGDDFNGQIIIDDGNFGWARMLRTPRPGISSEKKGVASYSEILYQSYIPYQVVYCPDTNYGGKYEEMASYGGIRDNGSSDKLGSEKTLKQLSGTQTWVVDLRKMKNTSKNIAIADSVNSSGGQIGSLRPCAEPSGTTGNFSIRHSGYCNMAFLDGHVGASNLSAIIDCLKKDATKQFSLYYRIDKGPVQSMSVSASN